MAKQSGRFTVALPKPYSQMTEDERRVVALQIAHAAKNMAAKAKVKKDDGDDAA